jgi:hypothetical protein
MARQVHPYRLPETRFFTPTLAFRSLSLNEELLIMAILSGLRRRFAEQGNEEQFAFDDEASFDCVDETLISDARSAMRPMQFIESKFGIALARECGPQDYRIPVSSGRFE